MKAFCRVALALAVAAAVPAGAGRFDKLIGELDHQLFSIVPQDAIPALTNPAVTDAASATFRGPQDLGTAAYVADSDLVVGVVFDGEARAYPVNLGWWHEIINDRVGDRFVSVTHCPLTGTSLVFDATDEDGSQVEFGVSGLLLNSNLVLYDRRDNLSLYPQMTYIGLIGRYRGERLRLLPAVETTWAQWKAMYPETVVPRIGTGMERYSEGRQRVYSESPERYVESANGYPYGTYRHSDRILFPVTTSIPKLSVYHAKDVVLGLCLDEHAKAYALDELPARAVINDRVGDRDVLVVFDAGSRTAIPYDRTVDGRSLTFHDADAVDHLPLAFADVETGSRWNMLGVAVSGPLAGSRLRQLPAHNAMWFAWSAFWPASDVWDGEGIVEAPTLVGEAPEDAAPDLRLGQNAPNPFNARTRIDYRLPAAGPVELSLYSATGQRLRTLVRGQLPAGAHTAVWDGRDDAGLPVASGLYLYQLRFGPESQLRTRRLLLLR